MFIPSQSQIDAMKRQYPEGTRVQLLKMDDDVQAPPIGTCGTVQCVDDVGSVHVVWDNGSHLAVVMGEDSCRIIPNEPNRSYTMPSMIKQIQALDSIDDFYDKVREIIGWKQHIHHSDHNIKKLQAVADARFEELLHNQMLDKAKKLINDFCEAEYEHEADFTDLQNIGIAYTTLTDDELPIQVTVDLVDFKISYEFDNEVFKTEQYDNLDDMIANGLTGLDFSDLVEVPDNVIERHTSHSD